MACKDVTYIKIVIHDAIDDIPKSKNPSIPNNKSGKLYIKYGRECDSTTNNKIFTKILNELLQIAKNKLTVETFKNIEKIDISVLNRRNGLCDLIEIICRLLNDKYYLITNTRSV